MDRKELAEFLRRRRETLRPRDVGLVEGPRRRTQGLRREEVAQLVGMSTDYYARLEQQRAPQPSLQITTALARALRLTPDERDHLFALVGHNAPARFQRSEHVSPALMRVLERLNDDTPALVLTDMADTLAMNPIATALLGDQTRHTGLARSAYYRWFMDPAERLVYPEEDHPRHGRAQAARLRAALTTGGGDPRAARIVAELQQHSPEFVRVWELQEVAQRYRDSKTILHPDLGRIDVDAQVLFTENRAQTLVVMTARPGTESQGKLELLSVIGHQQLTP
ncbi:helix-turn-helix transcriptional regulator [Streptomyces europaeiscabiei]|uniref:helix-turn-helix transcriptional regulator n=1 Tax=Streptomyces europaeiscabiei TaxID=146819 RepID=UPI0029AF6FA4|nr:helix-turn-helix transcriptional regulator [Streptomyces europaeiscabiei]MDX3613217.1 helix-turn-helix transcriptional regulator [Streptomyces europaeiscabiei]